MNALAEQQQEQHGLNEATVMRFMSTLASEIKILQDGGLRDEDLQSHCTQKLAGFMNEHNLDSLDRVELAAMEQSLFPQDTWKTLIAAADKVSAGKVIPIAPYLEERTHYQVATTLASVRGRLADMDSIELKATARNIERHVDQLVDHSIDEVASEHLLDQMDQVLDAIAALLPEQKRTERRARKWNNNPAPADAALIIDNRFAEKQRRRRKRLAKSTSPRCKRLALPRGFKVNLKKEKGPSGLRITDLPKLQSKQNHVPRVPKKSRYWHHLNEHGHALQLTN
jgi:hypothetical protein